MRTRLLWLGLACGWFGLCASCGSARAEEAALIDPSTTIVTVDGVPLSAGHILVPAGKDLTEWWAGRGHDAATQQRVRTGLEQHSEAAIDTELQLAMFAISLERLPAATAEQARSEMEQRIPFFQSELREQYHIDDWSQKSPEADPCISTWLTTQAEAKVVLFTLGITWLDQPKRADLVRAYWGAHRDRYVQVQSARWRQLTVTSEAAEAVARTLRTGKDFAEIAKQESQDRYRAEGGLVESKTPHLWIDDNVIAAVKGSKPGQIVRVVQREQVIFVKSERVDVVEPEFFEVKDRVRSDLARLHSSGIGKHVAAKRRATSRIEWAISINKWPSS